MVHSHRPNFAYMFVPTPLEYNHFVKIHLLSVDYCYHMIYQRSLFKVAASTFFSRQAVRHFICHLFVSTSSYNTLSLVVIDLQTPPGTCNHLSSFLTFTCRWFDLFKHVLLFILSDEFFMIWLFKWALAISSWWFFMNMLHSSTSSFSSWPFFSCQHLLTVDISWYFHVVVYSHQSVGVEFPESTSHLVTHTSSSHLF